MLRQRIAAGPQATAAVVDALAGHAAQRARHARVRAVAPWPAGLEVELHPFPRQGPCVATSWTQACPNEAQRIPLCTVWTTWVRNTGLADLWVEAFVLRADGTTRALQADAMRHRLAAGGGWLEVSPQAAIDLREGLRQRGVAWLRTMDEALTALRTLPRLAAPLPLAGFPRVEAERLAARGIRQKVVGDQLVWRDRRAALLLLDEGGSTHEGDPDEER